MGGWVCLVPAAAGHPLGLHRWLWRLQCLRPGLSPTSTPSTHRRRAQRMARPTTTRTHSSTQRTCALPACTAGSNCPSFVDPGTTIRVGLLHTLTHAQQRQTHAQHHPTHACAVRSRCRLQLPELCGPGHHHQRGAAAADCGPIHTQGHQAGGAQPGGRGCPCLSAPQSPPLPALCLPATPCLSASQSPPLPALCLPATPCLSAPQSPPLPALCLPATPCPSASQLSASPSPAPKQGPQARSLGPGVWAQARSS